MGERHGASRRFPTPPAASAVPLTTRGFGLDKARTMIQAMSRTMLPNGEVGLARLKLVPDGAISIETDGTNLVLRASRRLQVRFEHLLERHKHGELTEAEEQELQVMEQLDTVLSWLNRLARVSPVRRPQPTTLPGHAQDSRYAHPAPNELR
jgi:hypothetical protein